MKVLLTGATGFLGNYIIQELLENNYKIVAFGRNEKKGKELEELGVKFFKGNLESEEDLDAASEGVDYIIHNGGLSAPWGEWKDFYNSNVVGTENVLKIARKRKVKRVVFISSSSVYSKAEDLLYVKEDEAPDTNNLNYYIKSKIMAEKKVKEYKDVPSVIIRPRALFGIGDTSIIPRILKLNEKKGIPLFNNGIHMMDITCVENVAFAVRLAIEKQGIDGEIYNITNDEPVEFKKILQLFLDEMNEKAKFKHLNYNLVKVFVCIIEFIYKLFHIKKEPILTLYSLYILKYSQTYSIEKAKKELGYKPKITIEEGIKKYVRHDRKS